MEASCLPTFCSPPAAQDEVKSHDFLVIDLAEEEKQIKLVHVETAQELTVEVSTLQSSPVSLLTYFAG
jgi:hypothetical protein